MNELNDSEIKELSQLYDTIKYLVNEEDAEALVRPTTLEEATTFLKQAVSAINKTYGKNVNEIGINASFDILDLALKYELISEEKYNRDKKGLQKLLFLDFQNKLTPIFNIPGANFPIYKNDKESYLKAVDAELSRCVNEGIIDKNKAQSLYVRLDNLYDKLDIKFKEEETLTDDDDIQEAFVKKLDEVASLNVTVSYLESNLSYFKNVGRTLKNRKIKKIVSVISSIIEAIELAEKYSKGNYKSLTLKELLSRKEDQDLFLARCDINLLIRAIDKFYDQKSVWADIKNKFSQKNKEENSDNKEDGENKGLKNIWQNIKNKFSSKNNISEENIENVDDIKINEKAQKILQAEGSAIYKFYALCKKYGSLDKENITGKQVNKWFKNNNRRKKSLQSLNSISEDLAIDIDYACQTAESISENLKNIIEYNKDGKITKESYIEYLRQRELLDEEINAVSEKLDFCIKTANDYTKTLEENASKRLEVYKSDNKQINKRRGIKIGIGTLVTTLFVSSGIGAFINNRKSDQKNDNFASNVSSNNDLNNSPEVNNPSNIPEINKPSNSPFVNNLGNVLGINNQNSASTVIGDDLSSNPEINISNNASTVSGNDVSSKTKLGNLSNVLNNLGNALGIKNSNSASTVSGSDIGDNPEVSDSNSAPTVSGNDVNSKSKLGNLSNALNNLGNALGIKNPNSASTVSGNDIGSNPEVNNPSNIPLVSNIGNILGISNLNKNQTNSDSDLSSNPEVSDSSLEDNNDQLNEAIAKAEEAISTAHSVIANIELESANKIASLQAKIESLQASIGEQNLENIINNMQSLKDEMTLENNNDDTLTSDYIDFGSEILINSNLIYKNMTDATNETHGYTMYYDGQDLSLERGFDAIVFTNGTDIKLAHNEEEANTLVQNGYEVSGYRITNKYSYKDGQIVAYEGYAQNEHVAVRSLKK